MDIDPVEEGRDQGDEKIANIVSEAERHIFGRLIWPMDMP